MRWDRSSKYHGIWPGSRLRARERWARALRWAPGPRRTHASFETDSTGLVLMLAAYAAGPARAADEPEAQELKNRLDALEQELAAVRRQLE